MDFSLQIHKTPAPNDLIMVAYNDKIIRLEWYKNLDVSVNNLRKELNTEVLQFTNNSILNMLKKELDNYFQGKLSKFNTPIKLIGNPFQLKVWGILQQIPYGKTISYTEQASKYGNIKAIRATATANGKNPIAIIVPCHRVIKKNGQIGGYRGDIENKIFLLNKENIKIPCQ